MTSLLCQVTPIGGYQIICLYCTSRIVIDEPAWEEDLQMAAPLASGGLRILPLLQTHVQPAIDAVLQPSGTVILR